MQKNNTTRTSVHTKLDTWLSYTRGRVHGHVTQAELPNMQESGQFPDELVRIEVEQIHYVSSQTY
jgi:hypothetical protein